MRRQMCTSHYIWLTGPLLGSKWPEWNIKYGVYGTPTVYPPRNSLINLNQNSNRVKYEIWSEQKKIAPMGRGRPGPEGFGGGKRLLSPLFLFSLFYYWLPFLLFISFFSDWGGSWNFLVLTETNIYPSGFVLSGFKEFKNKNSYFPSGFIISRFYELMYNSRTIGAITN